MLLFLLGLSLWFFLEYFMHRFALHGKLKASHNPHHTNPTDKEEIFTSWTYVLAVSILICAIGLLFMTGVHVLLLYVGVVCGYLSYEAIHYQIHFGTPKSYIMKHLRRHHLRHHFMNPNKNFSITLPILDKLFGSFL